MSTQGRYSFLVLLCASNVRKYTDKNTKASTEQKHRLQYEALTQETEVDGQTPMQY